MPRASWSETVDRDALAVRLDDVALLDARVAERYRGDVEPVDPRAGHIPTAVSAPARLALAPDGRFLPGRRSASKLDQVAPGDRPVVASCGSGVTACHTILAFRVAGRADPILYPGSFSDWSRSDRPVATGDDPQPHQRVNRRISARADDGRHDGQERAVDRGGGSVDEGSSRS